MSTKDSNKNILSDMLGTEPSIEDIAADKWSEDEAVGSDSSDVSSSSEESEFDAVAPMPQPTAHFGY